MLRLEYAKPIVMFQIKHSYSSFGSKFNPTQAGLFEDSLFNIDVVLYDY